MRWLDYIAGYRDAGKRIKRAGLPAAMDTAAAQVKVWGNLPYQNGYCDRVVGGFRRSINL